jgi:hypothetical protein
MSRQKCRHISESVHFRGPTHDGRDIFTISRTILAYLKLCIMDKPGACGATCLSSDRANTECMLIGQRSTDQSDRRRVAP